MIKIPVTYIPSMNHYIRHSGKRHYRSDVTKKFEAEVVFALKQGSVKVIPTGNLHIVFTLKRNSRDLDNLPKVFIDVLARAFNFNDKMIETLRMEKRIDRKAESEHIAFEFFKKEAT
jgi:Holliday junction resolvase RusA-like endonuclease